MDSKGHAKHILARAARLRAAKQGPADPKNPMSVKEHAQRLSDMDIDVLMAKLSINDENPDDKA